MSKNYFIIYWKIKILGSTFPLKFILLNTIYHTLFILVIFWNLYILAWIAQKKPESDTRAYMQVVYFGVMGRLKYRRNKNKSKSALVSKVVLWVIGAQIHWDPCQETCRKHLRLASPRPSWGFISFNCKARICSFHEFYNQIQL